MKYISDSLNKKNNLLTNIYKQVLCFLSLSIGLAFFPPQIVFANNVNIVIYDFHQMDISLNGNPDLAIIECSFFSEQDTVYVIDNNGDMQISDNWSRGTDFVNDTWIFDVYSDNKAELIIKFTQQIDKSIAYLYFGEPNDGLISVNLVDDNIIYNEPEIWELMVISDGYWFLDDETPNQNLRFFFSECYDYYSESVDRNNDSIPDYEIYNLNSTDSECQSDPKPSGMWVNKSTKEPIDGGNRIFWPFLLGSQHLEEIQTHNKFTYFPFIAIDWSNGSFITTSLGQLVSGYPIESGYFIGSQNSFFDNSLNKANFENPMAYYDLAQDNDSFPELHIRLEYFNPSDSDLDVSIGDRPFNDIRYSWNQFNRDGLYWDFKVALAGLNEVNSSVRLDTFGVQTVPYEELPYWVSEKNWEWGTLVANEGGGTFSSEGIYEWSATNVFHADAFDETTFVEGSQIAIRQYLAGYTDKLPDDLYQEIREGMRGEFGYLYDKPYLYFSPIDHKLHLKKANHGVWNLGDGTKIRYENLNQDNYLDYWKLEEHGLTVKEMLAPTGFLIMADGDQKTIFLKEIDQLPSTFETFPPRDNTEWENLGGLFEDNDSNFRPSDFLAMINQFGRIDATIHGATLRQFRYIEGGYRFVLILNQNFRLDGDDLLGLNNIAAGIYEVTYHGSFKIEPITSAQFQLVLVSEGTAPYKNLISTSIPISLTNLGLEDAHDVVVSASIQSPEGEIKWLDDQMITVLGGQEQPISLPFAPNLMGEWQLQIMASRYDHAGALIQRTTEVFIFIVSYAPSTTLAQDLTAFGVVRPWQVLTLLTLMLLTMVLPMTAFLRLRSQRKTLAQPTSKSNE